MAPAIAARARAEGADLMLFVPLWPACHQSVGLIARAIEALGIPTIALTSCRDITVKVRPPRACFLDYPLGNNAGIPHDAANCAATGSATRSSRQR
jgi:D-proline reductase (dithiol) PrdB